jgi:hypothetical protein
MTAILLGDNAFPWIGLMIAGQSSVGISGIMWTNRLWETLVRMTFGIFMGSLVLLLIILYSGVPIV